MGMLHVIMMNAEHDCGGGDKECVATIPFVIWYSKQRREWARRSSSGCQSRSFNIAVTLEILSCWLAAHRCTFSIACFCLVTRGSQTEAAYSRCGRTSAL